MFINMGFVSPRPGKEKVLAAVMHSFAESFKGATGLIDTYVVIESNGSTLVGISVWNDKLSFEAAMQKVRPSPPPEPIEQIRTAPPLVRQFESV